MQIELGWRSVLRSCRLVFAFSFLMSSYGISVLAQSSTTGFIVGTVKDPSGAAVVSATVVATSPNSIQPHSATTAGDGSFTIPNLPPGNYTVTVGDVQGFRK